MRRYAAGLAWELPVWGRDRLAWLRPSSSPGVGAVEVAGLAGVRLVVAVPDGVALRHGGWPDGPALVFPPVEWVAFLAGVRGGEFDSLTDDQGG